MKRKETFAQYLHRKRLEASLKRGQWMQIKEYHHYVAEKMLAEGLEAPSQSKLFRWENGHNQPSAARMVIIKEVLGK
jgi:hypothetical protein